MAQLGIAGAAGLFSCYTRRHRKAAPGREGLLSGAVVVLFQNELGKGRSDLFHHLFCRKRGNEIFVTANVVVFHNDAVNGVFCFRLGGKRCGLRFIAKDQRFQFRAAIGPQQDLPGFSHGKVVVKLGIIGQKQNIGLTIFRLDAIRGWHLVRGIDMLPIHHNTGPPNCSVCSR